MCIMDITDKVTEKVYCYGHPNAYQNNSALETAALMNGGLNGNQMWNNPMMYLVWMWVMRYMNGCGNDANAEGLNFNSRAISQLQNTIDNNHNNDLVMQAVNGNIGAIRELSTTLNTDFNTISQAVCCVKSAIESVAGQVGYSAESVKNAIALGDANIIQAVQNTSCATQKAILEGNYQNQLATERQTGIVTSQMASQHAADMLQDCQYHGQLMSRIDQLANGVTQGFAQVGYAAQQNTQAIIQSQTANTQRIIDQMCANTTQALRDAVADKDRELQTQTIINRLRSGCGCNCNCNA